MFTKVDMIAIDQGNSDFLLDKGAENYINGNFEEAVRYYRLAASLGNMQAVSNLGYCYMYERSVPKDMDLAVALFKVAANAGIIDACGKLGSIYASDKYGMKDIELSIYYTKTAMGLMRDFSIFPGEYPSLCLSFAKMHMPGGFLSEDLSLAFEYLDYAKIGYVEKIENGETFYKKVMEEVNELLSLDIFEGFEPKNFYIDEM